MALCTAAARMTVCGCLATAVEDEDEDAAGTAGVGADGVGEVTDMAVQCFRGHSGALQLPPVAAAVRAGRSAVALT